MNPFKAIGISPSSEGIPCAQVAGVPNRVLLRAREVKSAIVAKQEIQPVLYTSTSDDRYTTTADFSPANLSGLRLLLTTDWMNASAEQIHEFESLLQILN